MKDPSPSAAVDRARDLPAHVAPRDRGRSARVTGVGIGISALLHLLFIAVYPHLFGPPPEAHGPSAVRADASPRGTRIVNVVEVDRLPSEIRRPQAPIEESPAPVRPAPPGEGPGRDRAPDAPAARSEGRSAAEILRPRAGDPRLTAPLPSEITDVSPERMAQLRLLWMIEELGDSAAAAAEAARRATDWTYTDEDGKKWGFSPGKIHLGGLTLPMPGFSAPVNSDAYRRAREDAEIARQAGAAAAGATQKERAKAIRERKDRERADAARKARPDTVPGG